MNTEIIQITSTTIETDVPAGGGNYIKVRSATVFGLGKDQRIYQWSQSDKKWFLY